MFLGPIILESENLTNIKNLISQIFFFSFKTHESTKLLLRIRTPVADTFNGTETEDQMSSLLLLLLQPLPTLTSSSSTLLFLQNKLHSSSLTSLKRPKNILLSKPLKIPSFALTESSGSPESLDPSPQTLLQELSVSTHIQTYIRMYHHVIHFLELQFVIVIFVVFLSYGVAGLL